MTSRLAGKLALLFGLLLAGFWLATEYVAVAWVIAGDSMEPALGHGDRVVVDLWTYRQRPPRPGEVVLLRGPLPGRQTMVKRASPHPGATAPRPLDGLWPGGAHPAAGVWVLGDHAQASTDSRSFGAVPARELRGRVVLRYWPPHKLGFL